jgi:hypothetical protein
MFDRAGCNAFRPKQVLYHGAKELPPFSLKVFGALLGPLHRYDGLQGDRKMTVLDLGVVDESVEEVTLMRRVAKPLSAHAVYIFARVRMRGKERRNSSYY